MEKIMKLSARNVIKGYIKNITPGAVNAEVVIEIAPEVEVVSIITMASVNSLGLKVGQQAYAVVKASNVMIAVD
jgi:molybdopterin-binding protein